MAADRLSANLLAADDIIEAQPVIMQHAASTANWRIRTLMAGDVLMPRQTPYVQIGSARKLPGPYYTDTLSLFGSLE